MMEARTRNLLAVTAVAESATGLLLVALPSRLAMLLLGVSLETPAELTLARVAGVALFALGVACWLARHDGQSRAARGVVWAMLSYNTAVAIVFAWAAIGLSLSGIGLWPAVLLHAVMTVWCVTTLR
jgi:hypothetical protein